MQVRNRASVVHAVWVTVAEMANVVGVVRAQAAGNGPASADTVELQAWTDTIVLTAPTGTSSSMLGAGLDNELRSISENGPIARAFPNEFESIDEELYRGQFTEIANQFELRAHANFLFAQANFQVTEGMRVLVYNVFCVKKVERLKLEAGMQPAGEGTVTPCEIWYGWALSLIIYGEYRTFTSEVRAQLMRAGGNLRAAAEQAGLQTRVYMRGLEPKQAGAINLVRNADDITQNFKWDKNAPPIPIFVKYMRIRSASTQAIRWYTPARIPNGRYELRITEMRIAPRKANGNEWDGDGSAPEPQIKILVKPAGRDWLEFASLLERSTYTPACQALHGRVLTINGPMQLLIAVYDDDVFEPDFVGAAKVDDLTLLGDGRADVEVSLQTDGQIQVLKIRLVPTR